MHRNVRYGSQGTHRDSEKTTSDLDLLYSLDSENVWTSQDVLRIPHQDPHQYELSRKARARTHPARASVQRSLWGRETV